MNYLNFGPIVEPRMFHGGRVGNTYLDNRQANYAMGGMATPMSGLPIKMDPRMLPSMGQAPMSGLPIKMQPQSLPMMPSPRIPQFNPRMNFRSPFLNNARSAFADGGYSSTLPLVDGIGGAGYIDHGTGAGGRADNIPANLSENEYVIDAETVALLGDGNPEAGARKLDEMREQIRRHKGQSLAKGAISADALPALDYCEGGYADYAGGGMVNKVLPRIKSYITKGEGRKRVQDMYDSGAIRTKEFERLMHEVEMSSAPDPDKVLDDALAYSDKPPIDRRSPTSPMRGK